jgi:hypothetical protein
MVRDGAMRHLRCPELGRKPPVKAEPTTGAPAPDPLARPDERGEALA